MKGISQSAEPILSDQYPIRVDHHRRPGIRAFNVASHLGHPYANLGTLNLSADSNAIDKVAIPEHLAHKPSRLSRAETSLIEPHPAIGQEIIYPLGSKKSFGDTFEASAEVRLDHWGQSRRETLKRRQRNPRLFGHELWGDLVGKMRRPEYAEPAAGDD